MNYWTAQSGNVAIMACIVGAVLFGAAGIAIDYNHWTTQRIALQESADAGSLAGAVELGLGGKNASARAKEKALLLAGANSPHEYADLVPAISIDPTAQTVSVSYTAPGRKTLSAFLIRGDKVISVASTAKVVGRTVACIYALNAAAAPGLSGNGSANLQGTNCAIYVNSGAATAMTNSGTISASQICVVGQYTGSGYSPTPNAGCEPVADPFADLVIPAPGPCTYNNLNVTTSTTLSPGTYCGGLQVSGAGTAVTLNPGRYFIVDGTFKVLNGGAVSGSGVAFILSGPASMDISGSGVVSTLPETSGELAGFSVVQDRAAPLGGVSKITGEGRFEFPGIIYLPRQSLDIAGRASGNTYTPTYAAVVADTIKISGQGELSVTADTSLFGKKTAATITVVNTRLIK